MFNTRSVLALVVSLSLIGAVRLPSWPTGQWQGQPAR